MGAPLIAIVGSVDPQRSYDPALKDTEQMTVAAEQLGRELAAAGCRIMVYSADPRFVEAHVVRGYVASGKARDGSVEVRFPSESKAASFPEHRSHPAAFRFQPDTSSDWEVSFYRSLADADGVLMLGGGQSSLVTGIVALGYGKPIVSVASFGGNAQKVWRLLEHENRLADADDHRAMAPPVWNDGAAKAVVGALLNQHRRRQELAEERRRAQAAGERRRRREALVAIALVVLSTLVVSFGLRGLAPGSWSLYAVVLFAPLVAGAAGATTKLVFEPETGRGAVVTVALGLAAGVISVLLFLTSQLAAASELLDAGTPNATTHARNLVLFAVVIGFIAGFTFESVYRKLARVDVVATESVERP